MPRAFRFERSRFKFVAAGRRCGRRWNIFTFSSLTHVLSRLV
jgi:hypothetical protein